MRLTKAQEKRVLGMLTKGIDSFVTHGFHFGMQMPAGWDSDRHSGSGNAPAPP